MDVMRQVMRSEGGVVGLYKGLVPTLLREVPGCGAMFAAYEAIKLSAVQQQVYSLRLTVMIASRSLAPTVCQHRSGSRQTALGLQRWFRR